MIVMKLGLPSHHDPQKNWDTLKALSYILELDPSDSCVLDAGSSSKSAILKWLSLLGYRRLHACDIRPTASPIYKQAGISFSVQDLTQTTYDSGFFHAITAISVIEHGVQLDGFLKEMSRILSADGYLILSTDYWSEAVDCRGIYPYGPDKGEMMVFQPQELEELCLAAKRHGFVLCRPLELGTRERAVRWDRVDRDYTFTFLALRKRHESV